MSIKANLMGIGVELLVCQLVVILIMFCYILSNEVSPYIIENDRLPCATPTKWAEIIFQMLIILEL